MRRRYSTIDADAVRSLVSVVDPCPRDLITYMAQPRRFDDTVERAVKHGRITAAEAKHFLKFYETGLEGYTYLEEPSA